jgi:tetratricopeptide (TPR) repeat protein
MIDRSTTINLIHASYVAGRYDFSRSIAADWLANWPQDAEIKLLLAEAELKDGLHQVAIDRLQSLLAFDPEMSEAYELLAHAYYETKNVQKAQIADACRAIVRGEKLGKARIPSWTRSLERSTSALEKGKFSKAIADSYEAVEENPEYALPMLISVKSLLADNRRDQALVVAEKGRQLWPECFYFKLVVAQDLLHKGDVQQGVELLHRIASDDPSGHLANKYLGADHEYTGLWPKIMKANLTRRVPTEVIDILGGNRIPARSSAPDEILEALPRAVEPVFSVSPVVEMSKTVAEAPTYPKEEPVKVHITPRTPVDTRSQCSSINQRIPLGVSDSIEPKVERDSLETKSEMTEDELLLQSIEQEFERLANRLKIRIPKSSEDARLLSYVVLTCRNPLVERFGEEKFKRLDEAIESLVSAIQERIGWKAHKIYVDDPTSMQPYGLEAVGSPNPWQIKLRVGDLDNALKSRNEMIGSLFIIGGHDTVPFHMLPNPTDDDDEVIPSDNPYATTDANYFAPEWPVGRLPSDDDIDFMVRYLRSAADEHRSYNSGASTLSQIQQFLQLLFARLFRRRVSSLGYSANIWRKASLAVFRAIGNPRSMITSPPAQAGALPPQIAEPVSLSYYNLHGLEDAPEWFGQYDPFSEELPANSVEFPIALRPTDIVNSGRAPRVVFTEACYGANILGKSAETAICLKFLTSGSNVVVGSTKISYGSVTPPLIAADLLGRTFWDNLNAASPVGEALRRSKLQLASEMHQRQGFLDGEDQKTLISFVLYGDPLFTINQSWKPSDRKSVIRKNFRPAQMKTMCARGGSEIATEDLEPAMLSKVRSIVSDYLPGMSDAICRVRPQSYGCEDTDHTCPTQELKLNKNAHGDSTVVVTFSKHIPEGSRRHPHYARLTMDKQGKVLKLAVSR